MTDKTMTLEMVRDALRKIEASDVGLIRGHLVSEDAISAWADAITRHLSQPAERGEAQEKAEPVAWMMTCGGYKRPVEFYAEKPTFVPAISEIVPLYTAPPPAAGVPDGWKLVPIDPTEAMCEAAFSALSGNGVDAVEDSDGPVCYSAMLSAAPSAPSPTIDVAAVREVIAELIDYDEADSEALNEWANELARAIGEGK